MRIGLMSDIPDELIRRKIKNVIERERQLHCTKARREMTTCLRDMFDHKRTNFSCQCLQIPHRQFPHILRRFQLL